MLLLIEETVELRREFSSVESGARRGHKSGAIALGFIMLNLTTNCQSNRSDPW